MVCDTLVILVHQRGIYLVTVRTHVLHQMLQNFNTLRRVWISKPLHRMSKVGIDSSSKVHQQLHHAETQTTCRCVVR